MYAMSTISESHRRLLHPTTGQEVDHDKCVAEVGLAALWKEGGGKKRGRDMHEMRGGKTPV